MYEIYDAIVYRVTETTPFEYAKQKANAQRSLGEAEQLDSRIRYMLMQINDEGLWREHENYVRVDVLTMGEHTPERQLNQDAYDARPF